jgi:hypothetical protein
MKLRLTRKYTNPENPEWVHFYPHFSWHRFTVSLGSYFDERIQLSTSLTTLMGLILIPLAFTGLYPAIIAGLMLLIPFGSISLNLPVYTHKEDCDYPQYGFYINDTSRVPTAIVWCWNMKYIFWWFPWDWTWVRRTVWDVDDNPINEYNGSPKYFFLDKWNEIIQKYQYTYTYVRNNKKVQTAVATYYVEEMEWRWRWFTWLRFPRLIRKSINFSFDKEIGEQSGSWKGGVMGSGYTMRPGESPVECIQRMERERRFE